MDQKQQTDDQFYHSLKKYTPLFYSGYGKAFFLINSKWQVSFITVIGCLIAYSLSIWFLFKSGFLIKLQEENSPNKNFVLYVLNLFMLSGLIISYFLTQFLNPGIRNPLSITEDEFEQFGKKYCYVCQKQVLSTTMYHCKQCGICIQNKDHHCLFFQKCMGGFLQQKCFKFFLLFSALSILVLFVTVIFYLMI